MSDPYPRLCEYDADGFVAFRVGLSLSFYVFRSHADIVPQVLRALEKYVEAVGSQALAHYVDYEGEQQSLDARGWEWVRRELREPVGGVATLYDANTEQRYRFDYRGRSLDQVPDSLKQGPACRATFWLPLEYLEGEGPLLVRELAVAIASILPFCSGHCGLSYNSDFFMGTHAAIKKICFRYPGIDIPGMGGIDLLLGTRINGVHWLNFLGPVVLKLLGGVEALRARLQAPGVTVQEIGDGRALVTLGEWPEAGDSEAGRDMSAYRELARVLEPYLYEYSPTGAYAPAEFIPHDLRRWGRRFLDE